MRRALFVRVLLVLPACVVSADDPAETMVVFLERYHRLAERDIDGRMELAEWCSSRGLHNQQAELLGEVLRLQPGHPGAYERLIAADARRTRPVDAQWAAKLAGVMGDGFRLHHSAHFTIVSESPDDVTKAHAQTMEDVYLAFFRHLAALGLRPMPPAGRLVGVVFAGHARYRDYLARYEDVADLPASGYYSWRTNRLAIFDDRDNPAFESVRRQLASLDERIAALRAGMAADTAGHTAARVRMQEQLRRLNAERAQTAARLEWAAGTATAAKLRHETAHQLFYNSGILRRGGEYPFWLTEGLAMQFEQADAAEGNGSGWPPVNAHRLASYAKAEEGGRLMPLAQLLVAAPDRRQDVTGLAEMYAQAWALVYHVWRRHPEALAACIRDVGGEREAGDDLLTRHIGKDARRIDAEVRATIENLRQAEATRERP